jgi:uncharacterized membrane protein YgcG
MPDDPDSEILIETMRIGNAIEVRAVSGGDGLEVAFSAPASAGEADINRLARAKLAYVRRKTGDGSGGASSGGSAGGSGGSSGGRDDGRGGVIV